MAMIDLELHEAMVIAMARRRRFKMLAQELTDAVREDGTYIRGDGKAPPRNQILARAQNRTYRDLFVVTGPVGSRVIRLKVE
jgi:hypothetical protein